MTLAATVECADGVERNVSECVECADGQWRLRNTCHWTHDQLWYPACDCVEISYGRWAWDQDPDVVEMANGDIGLATECTRIDGEWYDNDDCCTCESCRCDVHNDDSYSAPDGGSMCQSCWEDSVTTCDRCGNSMWNEDSIYDDDDCYICPRCSRATRSLIKSYSDKSANNKQPESTAKLLYGVELEVEHKTDAEAGAKYVSGFLDRDYVTFKRDGSLGHTGFEIVTRPDSMEVHKRKFKALFDDKPGKQLSSWSNGRCGMHVHITKSALSQLQLGKMLCFLNEPANVNMISKIAGRRPGRWCRAYKKKITDIHHPDDRYVALNITERTAEARIFRGTLSQAGFFKNLEFVQALVEFCAPANRGIREAVSAKEFCKWLPRRQYPTLHKFLVERGFIVWNHKRKAA